MRQIFTPQVWKPAASEIGGRQATGAAGGRLLRRQQQHANVSSQTSSKHDALPPLLNADVAAGLTPLTAVVPSISIAAGAAGRPPLAMTRPASLANKERLR